eukprot:jgi/Ulvmu1/7611/UM038_0036.1
MSQPEPTSWADDLKQYRLRRGSLSYSYIAKGDDVPKRFVRTTLVPFADTAHPMYSYHEPFLKPNSKDGSLERYKRHGWGNVSLLSQGTGAPVEGNISTPSAATSKIDMFSVLQLCNPRGEADAWFGNHAIDPSAGKKRVAPPADNKGRKDLFQVLKQGGSAPTSSDSWLGNQLIDPSKGKQWCTGPELRLGRPNLFPLMQQSILQEKCSGNRGDQSKAYADSWIGNHLIAPTSGKAEVTYAMSSNQNVFGGVLAPHVTNTDFGKVGRRPIGAEMSAGHSLHDTINHMHEVSKDDPAGQDWRARVKSRRHFNCTPRTRPLASDIMYQRVYAAAPEVGRAVKWTEDGPTQGRARVPSSQPADPDGGVNISLWEKVGTGHPPARPSKRLFEGQAPLRHTSTVGCDKV